ncbi:MAG: sulfatase-like hydrolase/transferase, partial [archaeon GB-1867-097]|nr:sulfatase-like hydrolase/transferase [Candidatus Culexmicrobium thermophilum]
SLNAIRNRDKTKPLFLCVNFQAVHPPFHIPEPYYSLVKDVELPENVGRWSEGQSPLQLYNLPGFLGSRYTRKDWRKIWSVYLGYVALLDYCVGQIISELKKEGLYEDTLIIFTADHGEMLGSHCLWQKMCMYEEATHIPLYIRLPKGEKAVKKSIDALVSHIDVFPTILDYLGISVPSDLSGVSLRPLIEGESIDREAIFIQFDGNGARGNFQRCVVKGNYKLIVDTFKDEIYFELYDVVNDKQELRNLAFDEKEKVEESFSLMLKYMKNTGDLLSFPEDAYEIFLENYSKFRI